MLCLKIHYLLAKLLIKIFWSKLWGYLCYTGGGVCSTATPITQRNEVQET